MPSRWIREDILTSERVNALSDSSEVFYRRLHNKCDDFGLYDARPSILRASLYPLRLERVSEADIEQYLRECESAGVVALYSSGGKPYLQVLRTRWSLRSEPKFPTPPWGKGERPESTENSCMQPCATVPVYVNDNDKRKRSPTETTARKRAATSKSQLPNGFGVSPEVESWAAKHGYTRLPDHLEYFIGYAKANGKTYADWDQALMNAIRNNWARLNGGTNGTGDRLGRDSARDRSAAGQVRAAVAKSRAERLGPGADRDGVAVDGIDVRPQVG